ncbi:hypothetical protein HK102_007286 [Quaeritorhiza haematococci]|nr:hypothetical protein HK102_007286 [Quaeritorhiza haematococci]
MPVQVLEWKDLPVSQTLHLTTPEKEEGRYISYLTVGDDPDTREPVYVRTPVCNGIVADAEGGLTLALDLGQDYPNLVSITKDFESKCTDHIVENSTEFFGGKRFTRPRIVESLAPSFDDGGFIRMAVKEDQIRDQYDRSVPLSLLKSETPIVGIVSLDGVSFQSRSWSLIWKVKKLKVHVDEDVAEDPADNNDDNESFF